ncbi:hypothetical protein ACFL9T_20685, partial [Thermodesulfobacteriota bacterium]
MTVHESTGLSSLDLTSLIILPLALCLFIYMAFIRTADQNKRVFTTLAQKTESERNTLTAAKIKEIKTSKLRAGKHAEGDSASGHGKITDVPMFLQKINEETIDSGVELRNVKKLDASTYQITAEAPFYRLVNFLLQIEQANLAVQSMSVRPAGINKNQINLKIRVLGGEMSENNLQNLKDFHMKHAKTIRDPFIKSSGPHDAPNSPDEIDLTWEYKLTGIGFDKHPYANIDHKNYHLGEELKGMRIIRIHKDRIELQLGDQKFKIG